MILATDLDRTLLPNGKDEYDGSLPRFFEAVRKLKPTLMYVSGRNLDLLEEAEDQHGIEKPDYFLGEVGTVMYRKADGALRRDGEWDRYIKEHQPNWERALIVERIGMRGVLELQEGWKQNPYKVSYYLRDAARKDEVLGKLDIAIEELGLKANVVWSVDPIQEVGLIDILPATATKVGAIEFLREKIGEDKSDVVYCGDSGNDILALTAGYKAIVVKNAPEEVKREVAEMNNENDYPYYIATGAGEGNGNYSSGILEGLRHYGYIS